MTAETGQRRFDGLFGASGGLILFWRGGAVSGWGRAGHSEVLRVTPGVVGAASSWRTLGNSSFIVEGDGTILNQHGLGLHKPFAPDTGPAS